MVSMYASPDPMTTSHVVKTGFICAPLRWNPPCDRRLRWLVCPGRKSSSTDCTADSTETEPASQDLAPA